MTNDNIEKELHKPYMKKIIIGVILTVLLQISADFNLSFIPVDANVLEKILLISSILSGIFLCFIPIFNMLANKELNIIKKVQEELALTNEIVLEELRTTDKICKLHMSNNFTFIKDFFKTNIIPNKDIVWIFEKIQINRGKKSKYLVIRTVNKKEYKVQIYQEKNLKKCYNNYSYYKHIIIGYDKDLDKLYKQNFDEFLNHQYYKED